MITLIISIIASIAVGYGSARGLDSTGWGIFWGITAFFVVMLILNFIFGRKLKAIVEGVQGEMQSAQEDAMKMVNRFQAKPLGSQKMMQQKVEKVVEEGIGRAVGMLDAAEPLYPWSILAEMQVNTLRMQLNFQLKNYDEVDRLLFENKGYFSRVLLMDPMAVGMKMTRQYHNKSEDIGETFRKGVKKFKYDKGTLLYGLYAWILIKQKKNDEALEVLTEAKDKTESEVMARNWQHVSNNKVHLFSNAGLGEQWYGLGLENPPQQKPTKGQKKAHIMSQKLGRKR
jgi:hypothetical protein